MGRWSAYCSAVWHLREFGDAVIPQVKPLLSIEDPTIRRNAALTLAQAGDLSGLEVLTRDLRSNDEKVRVRAANILGEIPTWRGVPALRKALEDPSAWVRAAAVEALGLLCARQATADVIARLNDTDATVRVRAVQALMHLRAREAVPKIIEFLKVTDSPLPALALGELNDPAAVPHLIDSLKKKGSGPGQLTMSALIDLTGFLPSHDGANAVAEWEKWWADHKDQKQDEWLREGVTRAIELLDKPAPYTRQYLESKLTRWTGRFFDCERNPNHVKLWHDWWKTAKAKLPREWHTTALSDRSYSTRSGNSHNARHIDLLADTGDRTLVPLLILLLRHEDLSIRSSAHCTLLLLTSETFDFDPNAREKLREQAIARWEDWAKRNIK